MGVLSDTKKVKTRKPHMCFACGRLHPKGAEMFRQGSVYACDPCKIIMEEFPELCIDAIEGHFPEMCVGDIPTDNFTDEERQEYNRNPSPWKILDILRQPITEG